jgi:hypothetical protein
MASRLYTDTLQEGSRFTRVDKGAFGLVDWRPAGIEAVAGLRLETHQSATSAQRVAGLILAALRYASCLFRAKRRRIRANPGVKFLQKLASALGETLTIQLRPRTLRHLLVG